MEENPYQPPRNAEPPHRWRSKLWRLIKTWPFTTWVVVALLLAGATTIWGSDYDAADFGALLVLTSAIWGFPFWVPMELGLRPAIAIPITVVACVALDFVFRAWRMRRRHPTPPQLLQFPRDDQTDPSAPQD
jgi:hypothetical protein